MGTSTSTYEVIVRQNVSTYTSQLFKFLKVHLLLSKKYLLLSICNSSSTSGQLST